MEGLDFAEYKKKVNVQLRDVIAIVDFFYSPVGDLHLTKTVVQSGEVRILDGYATVCLPHLEQLMASYCQRLQIEFMQKQAQQDYNKMQFK